MHFDWIKRREVITRLSAAVAWPTMGGIFISYRRSDSKSDARSICQRLEKTFGKRKVFIDVDSIRPGQNFQSVLNNDLEKCKIMLVVIGPHWLELLRPSRDAGSEQSQDYVRMEIASALEHSIPIFPVLVDGATMPEKKDLPEDLKSLAFRQAFSVRHESFSRDMWELEQEFRRHFPTRGPGRTALISGLSIILLGTAVAISYHIWQSPPMSATTYSKVGYFACFGGAEYPDAWRREAPLCTSYGCLFGKMSQAACLTLGAKKGSKTVIHGYKGTSRADECWLQDTCGDLRPHNEFTLFRQ
jgi:TIR domain-containing protein